MSISRSLTFYPVSGGTPEPVTVTIGMPEPDAGGQDWRVLVTVEGAGRRKEKYIPGVDGVQCVVESLYLLPTLLSATLPPGRLTFLGGDDLRFQHCP